MKNMVMNINWVVYSLSSEKHDNEYKLYIHCITNGYMCILEKFQNER